MPKFKWPSARSQTCIVSDAAVKRKHTTRASNPNGKALTGSTLHLDPQVELPPVASPDGGAAAKDTNNSSASSSAGELPHYDSDFLLCPTPQSMTPLGGNPTQGSHGSELLMTHTCSHQTRAIEIPKQVRPPANRSAQHLTNNYIMADVLTHFILLTDYYGRHLRPSCQVATIHGTFNRPI